MKRFGVVLAAGGALLISSGSLSGQSVVEYSTATAAGSSGAVAGAQGVSKSIGGILGNVNKNLDTAKKPDSAQASSGPGQLISPAALVRAGEENKREAEAVRGHPIRPEEIPLGLARSELVKKFGSPLMKASKVEGADFVEIYYYRGVSDIIVVTVREGKVSDISPPPAIPVPRQSASAQ